MCTYQVFGKNDHKQVFGHLLEWTGIHFGQNSNPDEEHLPNLKKQTCTYGTKKHGKAW